MIEEWLGELLRLAEGECSGVAVTEEARVDGADEVGDDMVVGVADR
jgi:hypothetical protein